MSRNECLDLAFTAASHWSRLDSTQSCPEKSGFGLCETNHYKGEVMNVGFSPSEGSPYVNNNISWPPFCSGVSGSFGSFGQGKVLIISR